MYLFVDTETTGLFSKQYKPAAATDGWPRLVELGWALYTEEGVQIGYNHALIKPDGFTIPTSATAIHGITTQEAQEKGIALRPALEWICSVAAEATAIIAHNLAFDYRVLKAEMLHAGVPDAMQNKKHICTMEQTVKYCAIPGYKGFKYPTLAELHYSIFRQPIEAQTHRALPDAEICARCFWELRKQGVL